jgi:hypothetical protein
MTRTTAGGVIAPQRQRSRRRRGAHDRFGRDGDLRPAGAPATTQTPAGALAADCSAHEALTRHLWWRRTQDRRCSTGRAGSEGERAACGSGGPLRPSSSARCPEADVLGQGALTSPGLFRNAAQPIARATARNRAIAHTRAPSSAVRSRPDHHTIDIHATDTERTAHTTGCELLDVLRYDHHSGPTRKRPQLCITKDRILVRGADAIMG